MGYGAGLPGFGAGRGTGYGAGAGGRYGAGTGSGYGAGIASGSAAPPTLSYASPQSWTYGAAITTLSPTTTGATSFAVQSGTLPTGVSLNTTTGDITGTPTVAKVAANVVIRATGPGGTADATINIAVPSPLYTSLREFWDGDSTTGAHAGLTLTNVNSTAFTAAGPDGGANGAGAYVSASKTHLRRANETALVLGAIDWTICAFVKPSAVSGAAVIMSKYGSAHEYTLYVGASGGSYSLYSGAGIAHSTPTYSLGTYASLVGRYVASSGKIGISVDGAAYDEVSATPPSDTGALNIGGNVGDLDLQYIDASACRFGIWARTLTSNELAWLRNSGNGRKYADFATYDGG